MDELVERILSLPEPWVIEEATLDGAAKAASWFLVWS